MKCMFQIMVPCSYNDGKPVRTRHHREWDRQVRKITGGLTILSPSKGQWISKDGELFSERMIPVNIIATDDEMKTIAKITIKHYKQLAVMYFKISEESYIVHA